MTYQVKLDEAKVRLPDLVEAAIGGEDVFILKDGQFVGNGYQVEHRQIELGPTLLAKGKLSV